MGIVDRITDSVSKGMSWLSGEGLTVPGDAMKALSGSAMSTKGVDIAFLPMGQTPESLDVAKYVGDQGELAYRTNAVVFACVSRLVTAYLEAPLIAFDKDDQPDWKHPWNEFVENPDPLLRRPMAEIQLRLMTYAAWGGTAYLHKVYNRAGQLMAIQPYSIHHMQPESSGRYYNYQDVDGRSRTVPAEQVIAVKWPSAQSMLPNLGLSPVLALAAEIGTDTEATRYVSTVLANDAVPRTVLVLPEDASNDAKRDADLQQKWEEKYTGSNRGRVAVLSGGVRLEKLSLNLEELAIEALRKVPEARICGAFGVPAILAGVNVGLERSTFSNTAEARRFLAENQMASIWTLFGEYINLGLRDEFKKYGKGYRLGFDRTSVASLQENEDKKSERIIKAWESTLLTRNEGRAALGYPPLEGALKEFGEQFKAGGKPLVTVHESGDPNSPATTGKESGKASGGSASADDAATDDAATEGQVPAEAAE